MRYFLIAATSIILFFQIADAQEPAALKIGIEFDDDNTNALTLEAGAEVCFDLTARDENGSIFKDWNQIGGNVTITLRNSTANTDSSTRSWNSDSVGYLWARLTCNGSDLEQISPQEWTLSKDFFIDGQTTVCLSISKADTGVVLEISPEWEFLNQTSRPMIIETGPVTNYLMDLTSAVDSMEAVFVMRRYEICAAPRDRYMNVVYDSIPTKFTARFPGEFDDSLPGLSDVFRGTNMLAGMNCFYFAARIPRDSASGDGQWIRAYKSDDGDIQGETNPYSVLDHPPASFSLIYPPDRTHLLRLNGYGGFKVFSWEQPDPPDPYADIRISRLDDQRVSDTVHYTLVFIDSLTKSIEYRIESDNNGRLSQATLEHRQLWEIIMVLSTLPTTKEFDCIWFVEATDGLYTTRSQSSPGHHVHIEIVFPLGLPQTTTQLSLSLNQNYPNPFNSSTHIQFTTSQSGWASLKIFDILGHEVTTLANAELPPGEHTFHFDAMDLPTGIYTYILEAEETVISRQMVLLR